MKLINLVEKGLTGYKIKLEYSALIETAKEQFGGLVVGLNLIDEPISENLSVAGVIPDIITLTLRFNNGEMTMLFVDHKAMVNCIYTQFKHKTTGLFSVATKIEENYKKYSVLNLIPDKMALEMIEAGSKNLFQ